MIKKDIIEKLANYFAKLGRIMDEAEYKQLEDAPVHPNIIKRRVGRWIKVIYYIEHNFPEQYKIATGVIKRETKAVKTVKKAQAPPTVIEPAVQDKKDEENE